MKQPQIEAIAVKAALTDKASRNAAPPGPQIRNNYLSRNSFLNLNGFAIRAMAA
jgi:hypothetical protein